MIVFILMTFLLLAQVLRIPGQEATTNFFKHSYQLAEGINKTNQDVYQGVMYSSGKTSVAEFTNTAAYTDMTTMTDTFKINKRGMALVNFNSKITGTADEPDNGAFVKIVVDGVDVTASERIMTYDYYVTVAASDYPIKVTSAGYICLSTIAIIQLDEGEHTIKIQGKKYGAADTYTYDRRMDIVVWAAPEQ